MVTHYFTLHALNQELNALLQGATLNEVFTQQKNELIVSVSHLGKSAHPMVVSQFLCISVDPKLNYFFVRDQFIRAKKNSVDLFPDIIGLVIDRFAMHPCDRMVQLVLSNGWVLYAQLYNTVASNIVLVDDSKKIREAFKNNKELVGNLSVDEEKRMDERVFYDDKLFQRGLVYESTQTIFAALKRVVPIFGSTYSREVLHRAHVDEKTLVSKLNTETIERIRVEIQTIREETTHPEPGIYYRGDEAKILSMIPLQHMAGSKRETFNSINDAIKTFVVRSFRSNAVESEKKSLFQKMKLEFDRSRRSLEIKNEQLSTSPRGEKYERIGKVIMANLQHLTKGTKQIELPDIFADDNSIHIILDPKLTPARNAERYFDKAKKAKIALIESEKQGKELSSKMLLLEKLLLHLDNCQSNEQVQEFKKEYEKELSAMKLVSQKAGEERSPFRVFTVVGGFEVWVGKSSANNDLLTMHYAKPNDLWFHVRGAGGSHTVLKVGGGNAEPTKEAIHQAAGIAAYYSKMRKAGSVPVAYCERKFVRKPPRSAEGSVVLEREKVIFVKPVLP